jgi:hypothetical protein
MTRTFFSYNATLMSPRTPKYVEAMIREGDGFDYIRWLKSVREEEAQAKQAEATGTSGELAAAEIDRPISTPDSQAARPSLGAGPISKPALNPKAFRRTHRQAKSQTPKARLRRWLEKVCRAWREFQASRTRDAVYEYLAAVFAIVEHYKVRRRTTRLLRHAFDLVDLPFDKNTEPFTAIIRCTCGNTVDTKMISKWGRALRYAGRQKEPETRLKTFMKNIGGVNACADRYARLMRLGKPHNWEDPKCLGLASARHPLG